MVNEATGYDGPSVQGFSVQDNFKYAGGFIPGQSSIGAGGPGLQAQVQAWMKEQTGQYMPRVIREVFKRLFHQIIDASPVDTGRFVMHWELQMNDGDSQSISMSMMPRGARKSGGVGGTRYTYTESTRGDDYDGSSAKEQKKSEIDGIIEGSISDLGSNPTMTMVNPLPYAMRLEYGYSTQAPSGMIRKTMEPGNVNAVIMDVLTTFGHGRGS